MSVMKDITNYSPITAMAHHERPADENVFIATTADTPPLRRSPGRAANKRLVPPSTSESETAGGAIVDECDMSSVFMTPTEDRHFFYTEDSDAEGYPVRKRLRLAVDRPSNRRVPLPVALNGLTKVQLVNLVNNLVYKRQPELEEVSFISFDGCLNARVCTLSAIVMMISIQLSSTHLHHRRFAN